jgi:hypothetical protein
MPFAKRFSRVYHDGGLTEVVLGPRREVRLTIRLDPVWNEGNEMECTLHLSDIKNYEAVKGFFQSLASSPGRMGDLDQVVDISWTEQGNVTIDLDGGGFTEVVRPKAIEL